MHSVSPPVVFLSSMLISEYQYKYTCNCQLTSCYYFQTACGSLSGLSKGKKITQNTEFSHYFPQAETQNGLISNMWFPRVKYESILISPITIVVL